MGSIIDRIKTGRNFSLEINPPTVKKEDDTGKCELVGQRLVDLVEYHAKKLQDMLFYEPAFVSCTYHQKRFELVELEGGTQILQPYKTHIGSDQTIEILRRHYNLPFVPHIICGGFSKEETAKSLQGMLEYSSGFVAVRGDPNHGKEFIPHPQGFRYANELVAEIAKLKEQKDVDIFVGGYPECHYASANRLDDLETLKRKQDVGATGVMTQICFDADTILRYRDFIAQNGVNLHFSAGLKVIDAAGQISGEKSLPAKFQISIPEELWRRITPHVPAAKAGDVAAKRAVLEIGQEHAINQAQRLYDGGVTNVQFYSQNKPASLVPVLQGLGFSRMPPCYRHGAGVLSLPTAT